MMSGRGRESVAFDIADIILENDMQVEVLDRCYSACASIILPAARDVILDERDIIGLHGGSILAPLMAHNIPGLESSKEIQRNQERMLTLYEAKDGDVGLIIESMRALKPLCLKNVGSTQGPAIHTRYNLWIPNTTQIKSLGINTNAERTFGDNFEENGSISIDNRSVAVGPGKFTYDFEKQLEVCS